ncbi:NlpC/P60 family protein [Croceicoccus naphthovorans]|uniref:NlpC/P60 family protein n=1 Tax=Croceicoccus naphthovorans TaxID=1348774 RepID=UPI00069F16C3|nr:NlpC/P60 family protein [Croceicoccus naphthovorans]MBB3991342.1 NlpC/P60 family putative phage cell wall peptidase [Croceicoccus naphthovorans]
MISGADIVTAARGWIGTPFAWGQALRGKGCDCKGLIVGVARELALPGADSIEAQFVGYRDRVDADRLVAGMRRNFDPVNVAQDGDVLLLTVSGKPQHLAIYAGAGRMIHTYSRGPDCVIEVPMASIWRRAVASVWRWKFEEGAN